MTNGGSVIRTVSLTAKTAEIASKMDNFSLFVRTALMIHAGDQDSFHTMDVARRANGGYRINKKDLMIWNEKSKKYSIHNIWLETFKCDPFNHAGQCPVCWPVADGPLEIQVRAETERLTQIWVEETFGGEEE